MTISSNENGTGLQYERDAHSDLERAIDALNRGDHAAAIKLCETVISQTIEGDPARTEAELRYVEAVIMRGHIYSAFDLFVMGDLYYLTPEVRAEIKPHYDVYRRCSQNPKSITEIIDGLGRSYDVEEVYGKMLEKQTRHDLIEAAGYVKDLCRLIDKHYSADKDFQADAFKLYLYLVTCVHRPEVQNLMLENYDEIFGKIAGVLRSCLLEKEVDGRKYTMTGLISTAAGYAKALRFLREEDISLYGIDEDYIVYFKRKTGEIANYRLPAGDMNAHADFMKLRDMSVKLMEDIMAIERAGGDKLTEKNRAKVWDYHGDTMD